MMEEQIRSALLGYFIGDGFGSQTEGLRNEEILELGELREVYSFEEAVPHCGISSYVSDLPLLYGLSFLELEHIDYDHLRSTYSRYIKEEPAFLDGSLSEFLSHPSEKGEKTIHLTRVVMSGILSALLAKDTTRNLIETEIGLTSTNTIVLEAGKLYVSALVALIHQEVSSSDELFAFLMRSRTIDDELKTIIQGSWNAQEPKLPEFDYSTHLRAALLAIFSTLHTTSTFIEGMITLAQGGGSARLNCALYGALAGALYGEDQLPESWISELHVSSALEAMIKKQTLYRRETLTFEKLADSLSRKLGAFEE
ncbi:MAG: ADP-ribosylglycohydrolase family protein [Sphaerochaeta sp.]